MALWLPPPIAKVYEALGALADGRISYPSPTSAKVISSSGDKIYTVEWAADFSWMTSDDNASRWQGYFGYPMIMVLLEKKPVPYDPAAAQALKAVPWKKINTKHKNDYDRTIADVLQEAAEKGFKPEAVQVECGRILEILKALAVAKPARRVAVQPPPKQTQGELF